MGGFFGVAEAEEIHPVFHGQALQLAVVVAAAGVALPVVIGEQEIHDVTPRQADLFRMGLHLDGGRHRERAGGLQGAHAFHLHQADPADPRDTEIGVMAEGGDVGAQLAGGLQDGGAQGDLDLLAIDHHGDLAPDRLRLGGIRHGLGLLAGRGPAGGFEDAVLGHGRLLGSGVGEVVGPTHEFVPEMLHHR